MKKTRFYFVLMMYFRFVYNFLSQYLFSLIFRFHLLVFGVTVVIANLHLARFLLIDLLVVAFRGWLCALCFAPKNRFLCV